MVPLWHHKNTAIVALTSIRPMVVLWQTDTFGVRNALQPCLRFTRTAKALVYNT